MLLTALIFVGNSAAGYLLVGFFISYGSRALKMPAQQVLMACTLAAAVWLATTLLGGWLGRIGRVRTFQIGYVLLALWAVPMWGFIDAADIGQFTAALVILALPLGPDHGPQAALYAEMFPAGVRYSASRSAMRSLHPGRRLRGHDRAMDHLGHRQVLDGGRVRHRHGLVSLVAVSPGPGTAGATLHGE